MQIKVINNNDHEGPCFGECSSSCSINNICTAVLQLHVVPTDSIVACLKGMTMCCYN